MNRRLFLYAAAAAAFAPVCSFAESPIREMGAAEAREAAIAGDLVLLDIRRPDEWAQTGVGDVALEADMTSEDFGRILVEAVDGDRNKPVALICRTGARSSYLSDVLAKNGFTNIVNVREGMAGSSAGDGWVKKGLPLRQAGEEAGCRTC